MTLDALRQARQLSQEGQLARAIDLVQRTLQREPNNAEALHLISIFLARTPNRDRAIYFAERAASAAPANPQLLVSLANILHASGKTDNAIAAIERAGTLSATNAPALLQLASLCWSMGQLRLALQYAEQATSLNPTAARGTFASFLTHTGQVGRAVELLRSQLSKDPGAPDVLMNLVQALNYWPDTTPAEVFDLHRRLGATYARFTRPGKTYPGPRDPDRRLRVGLISPDFYSQSVAYFAEPIIRHLDRTQFEVFCYSSHPAPDEHTRRMKLLADLWRNIANQPHQSIHLALDNDRLDILIELAGLTTGNVLPVIAARPAPIQITALGYPNTTGLPQIDYRLVDAITDPPDSLAVEKLHRLPGCFLCYQPPIDPPPPRPSIPSSAPITFGSFNAAHKISPPTIDAWVRILQRTPHSRLLLKASVFFSPDIRDLFTARFTAAGLEPDRIELLPPIPNLTEHLALYLRIDIALDPFPYNGTTTTCEALFMGIPVITLRGTVHASRVGASLLSAIGLPELITDSVDHYVDLATTLAADPARRTALHADLRPRMLASPLCDGPTYASNLGTSLREMWRQWCKS